GATVSLITESGVELVSDDYVVDPDVEDPAETATVKVTFTPAGLAKLTLAVKGDADAAPAVTGDPSTRVIVTVNTKVNSIGTGETAAIIPNEAVIFDNATKVESETGGIPTDTPETKWGAVNFTKVAAESDEALEDAIFQVFASEADALAQENALTAFNAEGEADTQFISGSGGKVVIEGLRYSRFANNETIDENNPDYQQYWLVEITSPDGYELLANPIAFEVNSPSSALVVSGAAGGDEGALDQVVNVPHNAGFELPLTGGTGTLLITIIGGAALAFVLIAGSRKRSANQA
ncbi:MAG TPA: SpaH/EbpB family LPXTG-anchored major pilin, partial [Microbacteriaceae bacterium]|nr:SpaH/EbpB family LPXTG-anchored major pilin [Microbacteriaceae bacterium]